MSGTNPTNEDSLDDLKRRIQRDRPYRPSSPHNEPVRRPEHGVPPKSKRGRRGKRRRKPRKKVNALGPYQDFPAFFSKARYRERRKLRPPQQLGQSYLQDQNGLRYSIQNLTYTPTTEIEKTRDEIHPWIQSFFLNNVGFGVPTERVDGKRYRPGGPFDCSKSRLQYTSQTEVQGIGTYLGPDFRPFGGFLEVYTGGHVPSNWSHFGYNESDLTFNVGSSGPFGPAFADPEPYSASAYKRYAPKTSFSDLGVTLGEMRELPGLVRDTAKTMKDLYSAFLDSRVSGPRKRQIMRELVMPERLGKEFLAEQFGWAPFIGDLMKTYRLYKDFDRRYAQVVRANGEWVKRGGTVLQVSETSPVTTNVNGIYPTFTGGFYKTPLSYVTTRYYHTTERKVWFEGSYRYFIPGFDRYHQDKGSYEHITSAIRMAGVMVSPSVIWDLTPWSWLVDWFSNAGDVIDNFSRFFTDGLVTRYAYCMARSQMRLHNDSTIHYKSGDVHCHWYRDIDIKRRICASPYGFGLSDDDLSIRQWAILAALGLSRGNTRTQGRP